jgi:hypothetical protein
VVRALVLLWLLALALPLGAGTAAAHGDGGLGPEAHIPRIVALEPPIPGLDVRVIESGHRLRIDNHTGLPVEVLADSGPRTHEPLVADGGTARWTDHRVRAAAADPAPVEGRRAWAIPMRVGDTAVTLRGEQVWPDPPASLPWWLATLLAAAGAALVGIRAARHRSWAVALAGVTLAVVAAHVVHVLGGTLIVEDQPLLQVALGAAGPALLAWVLGLLGAVLTVARRGYGPLLCSLSGALFALVTAFNANNFGYPVLPFAWAADLDRLTVVLTLGAGAGLFLAGFAALRELSPAPTA